MPFPEHLDEGIIHTWLDGQLPSDEAAAVESHAASCESCAALVAEARGFVAGASRILGALDGVGSGRREAGGGGAAAPSAPMPRVAPVASRRRARRWMIPSAAAATLVVAIGTTLTMRGVDERVAVESLAIPERTSAGSAAAPAAPGAGEIRIALPTPSPSARPADASAPGTTGSPMGSAGSVATGARMMQKTLPPAAEPPSAQPFAKRVRTSTKVATSEQPAVAGAAPPEVAPSIQLRRQEVPQDAPSGRAHAPRRDVRATALIVTGRVADELQTPLPEATISIIELGVRARSGADGRFSLEIPAGRVAVGDTVRVRALRIGHSADTRLLTIPAQGDLSIDLALPRSAMALDAVAVTGVDAASAGSVDATADWRGCYLLERTVPGLPERFQLDSARVSASTVRHVVRAGADVVASWKVAGRDTVRISSLGSPERSWTLVRVGAGAFALDQVVVRGVPCRR